MLSLAVNNLLLFLLFLLFLLILLVVVVLVVERTVGSLWCSAISFPTQLCFQRRCGPSFSLPIDSRVLLFFENGGCQGNSFAFTFLTNALSSQMPPPSSSNTHTHTHTHIHTHKQTIFRTELAISTLMSSYPTWRWTEYMSEEQARCCLCDALHCCLIFSIHRTLIFILIAGIIFASFEFTIHYLKLIRMTYKWHV